MPTQVPEPTAFFRPPRTSPELAILEAARALRGRSSGEITGVLLTEDNEGTPSPQGALSEVVFGPVRDFRCACGKLVGPEHAGARCPLCHVECIASSARAERWGHVAASGGLVHRALGRLVARCLGWTEEHVWQVAFFQACVEEGEVVPLMPGGDPRMADSGPAMLRRLLSEKDVGADWPAELSAAGFSPRELILDEVPVTPPAQRPLNQMPGGARMPGLDSVRYQELLASNGRLRAMREAGREDVYSDFEHLALQTAFDALCVQLGAEPGAPPEERSVRPGMTFSREARYWLRDDRMDVELFPPPPFEGEAETQGPTGCAFLGQDAALVCFPSVAVILGLDDGQVRATHELPSPVRLVAVSPEGAHALFTFDGELHVLDLRDGTWVTDAPGMSLAAAVERAGSVYLANARVDSTVELVEVRKYLQRQATSPDGRLLWAEDRSGRGGVYSVDTGLRWVDRGGWRLDTPVPKLQADGTVTPAPTEEDFTEDLEHFAKEHGGRTDSAFTLGADGRWRFLDLGLLVVDGAPVRRLAFQGSAGAFDITGERLLIASEDSLFLLEVGQEPRILRRVPLSPV